MRLGERFLLPPSFFLRDIIQTGKGEPGKRYKLVPGSYCGVHNSPISQLTLQQNNDYHSTRTQTNA